MRASCAVHADETYWRQDGIGHYLWYAGNNDLALFHINRHQSSQVAQSILGNHFDGVLNADGYAAYNAVHAKERQTRLAHLIRKSEEIRQEIVLRKPDFQDNESLRFCSSLSTLLAKACKIGRKFSAGHIDRHHAHAFETRFYSAVDTTCCRKLKKQKVEAFRQRLLAPKREYDRLFYILKASCVQPTNNPAEQYLKNIVIFRKIRFGTRSHEGSLAHSVLVSLAPAERVAAGSRPKGGLYQNNDFSRPARPIVPQPSIAESGRSGARTV